MVKLGADEVLAHLRPLVRPDALAESDARRAAVWTDRQRERVLVDANVRMERRGFDERYYGQGSEPGDEKAARRARKAARGLDDDDERDDRG